MLRALEICEEHPNTAASLNNLAWWYWIQGRYQEAEPLYERALVIRENYLGTEHPRLRASITWQNCIGTRDGMKKPNHCTNER